MDSQLTPRDFVIANHNVDATRMLRKTAAVRQLQEIAPFLAHIGSRPDCGAYSEVARNALMSDGTRLAELCELPVFRAWWQSVARLPDWDAIDAHKLRLLGEFDSLLFDPEGPSDGKRPDDEIALAVGARYAPAHLQWFFQADNHGCLTVPAGALRNAAEIAAELEPGASAQIDRSGVPGQVTRSVLIGGRMTVTNFHPSLKLKLSGTNQRNSGIDWQKVDWENYPDDWDMPTYRAPFDLLEKIWPEEFDDQLETLVCMVPRKFDEGSRSIAFTVSSHQGAMFVSPGDPRRMLEMILHEKAHVKERYVREVWPLLEAEQTQERFSVPWRPDPRPIFGIFEGIYVFLQVVIGLARYQDAGIEDVAGRARKLAGDLDAAIRLIEKQANLTPAGREWLGEIKTVFETVTSKGTGDPYAAVFAES
ncbi:aKG-HExxH-type peptide beta-hydroxylase [Roseibium polysiphoniae]|uniref:HEXXH motif-containing protein n=1 Tax=Roseibium polysiphoniae TaxID=2571221 RepID=A0ABR9CDM1_9HYPH|nr:HEXXH motif-containing putative peptide modification protein [Roseibium polysiphoniae]MBD8877654.1 hypothetical protein [Roseibium polysiphoniae]